MKEKGKWLWFGGVSSCFGTSGGDFCPNGEEGREKGGERNAGSMKGKKKKRGEGGKGIRPPNCGDLIDGSFRERAAADHGKREGRKRKDAKKKKRRKKRGFSGPCETPNYA